MWCSCGANCIEVFRLGRSIAFLAMQTFVLFAVFGNSLLRKQESELRKMTRALQTLDWSLCSVLLSLSSLPASQSRQHFFFILYVVLIDQKQQLNQPLESKSVVTVTGTNLNLIRSAPKLFRHLLTFDFFYRGS